MAFRIMSAAALLVALTQADGAFEDAVRAMHDADAPFSVSRRPRDPAPNASIGKDEHLAWWQASHPELVLYTCDQKTPAWECFSGEGCSHVNVPLDLTQPGTLAYQLKYGVDPAKAAGYSAIAFDNFGLRNQWKACGSFSGPNGAWKQIYDAADPEHDAQYALDVIDWFRRATAAIHDRGLLVIPNFSTDDLDDPNVQAVGNITDGVLAEAGWTEWNPVPNTSSFTTPPPFTTPERFERQLRYVRNLQRAGKGYFAINEWGAGPDYGLNPSKFPFNVSGDANRPVRQFVTAAFMMSNGGASGIFLSCIQCYGGNAGGLGNLSIWPEYAAPVGRPTAEPTKDAATGVWSRDYSSALALVNPTAAALTVKLSAAHGWSDLYGKTVNSPVTLQPGGLVLLKRPPPPVSTTPLPNVSLTFSAHADVWVNSSTLAHDFHATYKVDFSAERRLVAFADANLSNAPACGTCCVLTAAIASSRSRRRRAAAARRVRSTRWRRARCRAAPAPAASNVSTRGVWSRSRSNRGSRRR